LPRQQNITGLARICVGAARRHVAEGGLELGWERGRLPGGAASLRLLVLAAGQLSQRCTLTGVAEVLQTQAEASQKQ
jgi:hypothetical protein